MGVHMDGGFAREMIVPVSKLHQSDTLRFDQLVVVEPLCIGAHAVHRSGMTDSDTVVVVGTGTESGKGCVGLCFWKRKKGGVRRAPGKLPTFAIYWCWHPYLVSQQHSHPRVCMFVCKSKGPVGMAVIQSSLSRGARVIAVDIIDTRLEFVRVNLGVEETINASNDDVVAALGALTAGEMASVVIDATGNPRSMNNVCLVSSGV